MNASREDVAKEAGVSVSTVSYVLNNSRDFSEETKRRVFDAVEKLNYKPHIVARGLSSDKSYQVAITMDNVINPYYTQILTGFQNKAQQMGYFVNICIGRKNLDKYLCSFCGRQLDGVLILTLPDGYDVNSLYKLADQGTKIIMGGIDNLDVRRVSLLDNNYGRGMELAFEHLLRLGHRDIFYLNSLSGLEQYDDRTHTFMKYAKKHLSKNPSQADSYMLTNTTKITDDFETGYTLAGILMASGQKFTAVICTTDIVALGAMKAFSEAGLQVPQDVSVIDLIIFTLV